MFIGAAFIARMLENIFTSYDGFLSEHTRKFDCVQLNKSIRMILDKIFIYKYVITRDVD